MKISQPGERLSKSDLEEILSNNRKAYQNAAATTTRVLKMAGIGFLVAIIFSSAVVAVALVLGLTAWALIEKYKEKNGERFEPKPPIYAYIQKRIKDYFPAATAKSVKAVPIPHSTLTHETNESSKFTSWLEVDTEVDGIPVKLSATEIETERRTSDSKDIFRYFTLHFSLPLKHNNLLLSLGGEQLSGTQVYDPIGKLDDHMHIYTNDKVSAQRVLSPSAMKFLSLLENELTQGMLEARKNSKLFNFINGKLTSLRVVIDEQHIHVLCAEPFSNIETDIINHYGKDEQSTSEILTRLDSDIEKKLKVIDNLLRFAVKTKKQLENETELMELADAN